MLERCNKNPLIKPKDVRPSHKELQVIGAFNPGAIKFKDEIILILRVAEKCIPKQGKIRVPSYRFINNKGILDILEFDENDPDLFLKDTRGVVYKGQDYLSSLSHLRLARSKDGIHFTVEEKPFLAPSCLNEKYGIEDGRITFIEGKYYINYTIVSQDSWSTALGITNDFNEIIKLGTIFCPENKDVAIFPEKINGKYQTLHRPNNNGFGKPSIWHAESPDLIHWGNHKCVLRPKQNKYKSQKIGGGSSPIKTEKGWLTLYHAKGDNSRYALFALLLDLKEPWKIIKQGALPIFEPKERYETSGFFGNVVFTNGLIEKDNKLYIYYGASDEFSCLAFSTTDKILSQLYR